MNVEELQAARDRERQTDKLQQLRESFYADAGEFIQQLQTERDRAAERVDDPFDSPEVSQLTDEINTAEQTVEAIYEKRIGKIVKAASFAAADLPAEAEGMTREEQQLFDTLVDDIKSNREQVLALLDGEEPEETADAPETTAPDPGVSAADLMGAGGESNEPEEISAPDPGPDSPPMEPPEESSAEPPEPAAGEYAADGDQPPAEPQQAEGDLPPQGPDRVTGADEPAAGERETPAHQGDAVRNDGGQPESAVTVGTDGVERRMVRITDDVGTFVGSDERDYDLERNDIVTLPESNASLLIDRDAAEQL